MPRVSVLMPVFNTAQYLLPALESIGRQTCKDLELIVVNDGSTDGCSEILKAFAAREPRMRLTERSNLGLIATRNELLDQARGEFVAWMDSDDLCSPDRIEAQLAKFGADPDLVCVGTFARHIDPHGASLGIETYAEGDEAIRLEQRQGSGFRFASTMQPLRHAIGSGGFREPFRIGEDFDFLLRVAERGRLANIPQPLYVYRQHLSSACSALGSCWLEVRDQILALQEERRTTGSDKLQRGEALVVPQADATEARRFRPRVLLSWANAAEADGNRLRAFCYVLHAACMAPFDPLVWRSLAKLMLLRPLSLSSRDQDATSSHQFL